MFTMASTRRSSLRKLDVGGGFPVMSFTIRKRTPEEQEEYTRNVITNMIVWKSDLKALCEKWRKLPKYDDGYLTQRDCADELEKLINEAPI